MRKRGVSLVSLLSFASLWSLAAAAERSADDARRLLLTGKYAEAAERYAKSGGSDGAIGLARARAAMGKDAEARQALEVAGQDADVQVELARLEFDGGQYAAAEKCVEAALRTKPEQLQARWLRGELFRVAGKLDEAERAYRWLVDYYNAHSIQDAEALRWIGLGAAQYARWNRLNDQFSLLVNELYPDAAKLEPAYWPARFEAGMLFLEKYNQADATREFKAALEINPNAAEVHAAMARLALEHRNIAQAEISLKRALEINPRLCPAWLVQADLAWANFQPQEAVRILEKHVLPLDPVGEAGLGRLAAACVLQDVLAEQPGSRFARLLREVTARNPHAGEFYTALADWLDDRHRLVEAQKYYHEAARCMPKLIGPQTQLGVLAMRAGREAEARKLFQLAFDADPFNVRVHNSLEVLGLLEKYQTLENAEAVIRFDQPDQLLAEHAAKYVAEIYPQLCRQFGYRPPQKPLIEIFCQAQGASGHQWFSTRMTGLPYLGPVAASTGHIVGMASPNDSRRPSRFNWARVLKHELVHVITLQQTNFNMPHWYTEGLAVWSEGCPRRQEWKELLVRRVPAGELFNLQTLNFGFTRPQSSQDWQMAYCQAELYVEYMLQRGGSDALGKLTAAYAQNLDTPAAIRRAFDVPLEEFERGYVEHLKKVVAGLAGLEVSPAEDFAGLVQRQRQRPDDPALAAELAYAHLRRGATEEAQTLADRALKLQPKQSLAMYVHARLHARAGRTAEAIVLLERSLDLKSPDLKTLNLLAGLKLKAGDRGRAAELYQLGASRDPHNLQWLRSLARVYVMGSDEAKLGEALGRLAAVDPDDFASRKRLAQLALSRKDYAAAADWANQALHIDVTDAEIHQLLKTVQEQAKP